MARAGVISQGLDVVIKTVAGSINKNNIASSNNGLACVTDLIVSHPEMSHNYISDALQLMLEMVNKPNVLLSFIVSWKDFLR